MEFGLGMERVKKVIIAHNRVIEHFDINPFALVYATEKEFGVKVQPGVEGVNWEVKWNGIRAVSIGAGWLAVANEEEIKLLDLCGHEIRTISFDR